MLNAFQNICAASYAGSDFHHVADLEDARACGDTLFTFLMIELSTAEGCDNRDEALRRLNMAIASIEEVIEACRILQGKRAPVMPSAGESPQ